jgi:general secretion pathway protein A
MDGDTLQRSRGTVRNGRRPDRDVLPSRAQALEALRAALRSGPVLLAGEAGSGKTWLADRLRQAADDLAWAAVDLAPGARPDGLHAEVGLALGLDPLRADRRSLAEFLALRAADGRRFGLVVDEAHLATDGVLEELRVLSNRLGRPDGFAAMLLVGQTELARRLATYSLAALESRLAARVQLRPIDADEACELIRRELPGRLLDGLTIERLHRDAGGNPARLLRLAAAAPAVPADRPAPSRAERVDRPRPRPVAPAADDEPEVGPLDPALGSRLAAVRPPLRVEENLIEVGWSDAPTSVDEPPPPAATATMPSPPVVDLDPDADEPEIDEDPVPVEDHYAALQAWQEWSRNQGRRAAAEPAVAAAGVATATATAPAVGSWPSALGLDADEPGEEPDPELESDLELDLESEPEPEPSALETMPNVWAEPDQGFAPYGPLFGRARQSNDHEA